MSSVYVIGNFIELEELGRGAFGVAYKAQNVSNGEIVCIKKISKLQVDDIHNSNYKFSYYSLNEALNMERLGEEENKFFPKFYEFVYTHDFIYIIMEYINDFVPLTEIIYLFQDIMTNSNTQNAFKTILSNIYNAVFTMHNLNIDHSDLKPDNILVNIISGEIRIIDYGLSCLDEDCKVGLGFTLEYLDPELFKVYYKYNNQRRERNTVDFSLKEQGDLWSLGCIIYEMLIGINPYKNYCDTRLKNGLELTYMLEFEEHYINEYEYYSDLNKDKIDDIFYYLGSTINLDFLLTRGQRVL